jgi:NAD-reducing hydrogenase small subunit
MTRPRLATVWLGGCSGCHMSFLDLDEFLVELAGRVDIVFSPFIDAKAYPEGVDAALVEGAVANAEHLALIRLVRERTRTLISFGDCAVTGNVTAMRNPLGGARAVLARVYQERGDLHAAIPEDAGLLPPLLDRVTPVHAVVPVECYIPGCPPPAGRIRTVLEQLIAGAPLRLDGGDIRFG